MSSEPTSANPSSPRPRLRILPKPNSNKRGAKSVCRTSNQSLLKRVKKPKAIKSKPGKQEADSGEVASSATDYQQVQGQEDRKILTIEGVAKLFHCGVDRVRRIPPGQLPFARPGKHNIYLREHVDEYVRNHPVNDVQNVELNTPQDGGLIDSIADSVRGRSRRRRTS